MLRRFVWVLLAVTLLASGGAAAQEAGPGTNAKAAVLMEAATGRVLAGHNADAPMLIASTTKIMTALVVLEDRALTETVTIPAEAQGVEGSSMYARAGDAYPIGEVLNGLMLLSGNDAAVALAIHSAGSVDAFVERMNAKAYALGMKNTVFQNPHGLWDENLSTARDMAVLTRAAMEADAFRAIVSQKHGRVGSVSVRNHNRLLWRLRGCEGVKTGFTKKAGRCLVSSVRREESRFIVVTLNDGDDWRDHTALAEYAFSRYPRQTALSAETVYRVPLMGGASEQGELGVSEDIVLPLSQPERERLEIGVFVPPYLFGPLRKGQIYGTVRVSLDGETLAQRPLIARGGFPIQPEFQEREAIE